MSTDWHLRCLDCEDTLLFCDGMRSHHMLGLVRHADTIASMAEMMHDEDLTHACIAFGVQGSYATGIDVGWFRKHLGHQLRPIDEYGGLLGECHKWLHCSQCQHAVHCSLEVDHEGPCKPFSKAERRP